MSGDAEAWAKRASELKSQLVYTSEEMDALRPMFAKLPADLMELRPYDGAPSIKEMMMGIAERDIVQHLPAIRELAGVEPPEDVVGPATPDDMGDLLSLIQVVRGEVVNEFEGLLRSGVSSEAQPGLVGLLHGIVQSDVDVLRAVAYRLHESGAV